MLTQEPGHSLFFGYVAAQTGNEKADITLRAAIGSPASPPGPSLIQISYIAAVFGLSLGTNVFVWYRVSGGMFNPSVSIELLQIFCGIMTRAKLESQFTDIFCYFSPF